MEILFVAVLIGLIPAVIAQSKGRNFLLWWLYGTALFIVALPHSLIMKNDEKKLEARKLQSGMKKCPYCAELIRLEAIVCRYCGRDTPALQETPQHNEKTENPDLRIQQSTKIIEHKGTSPEYKAWAFRTRGDAYEARGDLAQAVADYDEAIRLDPTDKVALANRNAALETLAASDARPSG